MNCIRDPVVFAGAETLADHDRRTGCKTGEESDQQVDDRRGSASYSGKGLLAEELSHDNGIDCVVELLEESPQQDRKEE